jgi:hypothetical protein
MKNGAIYVYYDPVNLCCVYVGSVQDHQKIERRHRAHLAERKGLLGSWLRRMDGGMPAVVERVPFAVVAELFTREDWWMDKLETRTERGGLNQASAQGPDHAAMGRAGCVVLHRNKDSDGKSLWAKRVLSEAWKKNPEKMRKFAQQAASKGCRRRNELYGNPATPEGCKLGGRRQHELHPGLAAATLQRTISIHPEVMQKARCAGGRSRVHARWHVARNKLNPLCPLCCSNPESPRA